MTTNKLNKPIFNEKKTLTEQGFNFTDSDKNYLLTYAGWRVHGIHLRRHPDKEAILDSATKYLEHPNSFMEVVKKAPSIMDTEGGVIIALILLENIASGPKSDDSKRAAEILRLIGRRDLLPKGPRGEPVRNRTDNVWLLFWHFEPEDLIDKVHEYKAQIVKLSKSCPENHRQRRNPPVNAIKPKGHSQIYQCCLEQAFEKITGKDIPDNFHKNVDWKGDYLTLIALRFISSENDVPFRGLHDIYYKYTHKGQYSPPLTYTEDRKKKDEEKLQNQSELEITDFKFMKPPSTK